MWGELIGPQHVWYLLSIFISDSSFQCMHWGHAIRFRTCSRENRKWIRGKTFENLVPLPNRRRIITANQRTVAPIGQLSRTTACSRDVTDERVHPYHLPKARIELPDGRVQRCSLVPGAQYFSSRPSGIPYRGGWFLLCPAYGRWLRRLCEAVSRISRCTYGREEMAERFAALNLSFAECSD